MDKTYRVYGVYDIIVKVNANDKEDLQRKVLLIRRLDDIKSTLTLTRNQYFALDEPDLNMLLFNLFPQMRLISEFFKK